MNSVNFNWKFEEMSTNNTEITRLSLFFKHEQFFAFIIFALFGQTDFFADYMVDCSGSYGCVFAQLRRL
jgi:hypothetical protein